jgi:hypothetical protein
VTFDCVDLDADLDVDVARMTMVVSTTQRLTPSSPRNGSTNDATASTSPT